MHIYMSNAIYVHISISYSTHKTSIVGWKSIKSWSFPTCLSKINKQIPLLYCNLSWNTTHTGRTNWQHCSCGCMKLKFKLTLPKYPRWPDLFLKDFQGFCFWPWISGKVKRSQLNYNKWNISTQSLGKWNSIWTKRNETLCWKGKMRYKRNLNETLC